MRCVTRWYNDLPPHPSFRRPPSAREQYWPLSVELNFEKLKNKRLWHTLMLFFSFNRKHWTQSTSYKWFRNWGLLSFDGFHVFLIGLVSAWLYLVLAWNFNRKTENVVPKEVHKHVFYTLFIYICIHPFNELQGLSWKLQRWGCYNRNWSLILPDSIACDCRRCLYWLLAKGIECLVQDLLCGADKELVKAVLVIVHLCLSSVGSFFLEQSTNLCLGVNLCS